MNRVYLLIGGNLGDRAANLEQASAAISNEIGTICLYSSIYETAPWGNDLQPHFLNQVILVETALSPTSLMNALLDIEKNMGRSRNGVNQPRTIDLDILYFNDEIIQEKELTIPHPRIKSRKFVLTPMHELAPAHVDPVHKKSIETLLVECEDTLEVYKYFPNVNNMH